MDETRDPQVELFGRMAEVVEAARAAIVERLGSDAAVEVGIILGSGLGALADAVDTNGAGSGRISYADIPGFVASHVVGHAGQLVVGTLAGRRVAVFAGRFHFYEGHPMAQTTLPVRVAKALGAHTLVVTNAAGGLNPTFRPGDLMLLSDHIFMPGLAGYNPLRGTNDDRLGLRFPPLLDVYTPELRQLAHQTAADMPDIRLHEGVYAMVSGPSFESRAELKMLRAWGGDAVGMSTAPETVVAAHAGLRVLGISTITNIATGEADSSHNHTEVLDVGREAGPRLARLITALLPKV